MKKLTLIALAGLLIAATGAVATVVGTAHDLSDTGPGAKTNVGRVCVFCHTPHQATAASKQDPLWNHTLSTAASYGVYASDTLNATPSTFSGGGPADGTANVSQLCMSCHDGTVAVHSLYNDPNEVASVTIATGGNVSAAGLITGIPNVGTDLSNDHPINFTYNAALVALDDELETPASTSWVDAGSTVPLFGGTLQCASCHDPHEDTNDPFMVKDNADSALCVTCHKK